MLRWSQTDLGLYARSTTYYHFCDPRHLIYLTPQRTECDNVYEALSTVHGIKQVHNKSSMLFDEGNQL